MKQDQISDSSLKDLLGVQSLEGKSFLDVGSGSGLFSLAAVRMAARVHSFDFDQESVACTEFLRERFSDDRASWIVERGDILDDRYLAESGPLTLFIHGAYCTIPVQCGAHLTTSPGLCARAGD